MGLEEVVQDILGKAKSDAIAVVREGKERSAEILQKAENEVESKEKQFEEDLVRIRDSSERKEMADAALISKKKFQNVRKELIERAYEILADKASKMPESERKKILESLIKKCINEISGVGSIYVNKNDVKLAASLPTAKGFSVIPENIIGGVIAESSDGNFRVDYSFDRIIESLRETRTKELSDILF